MRHPDWQPQHPFSAIVFDCDGTLSTLEGVDELAKMNNVGEQVALITDRAMSISGLNPQVYQTRLNLINPRYEQVLQLGKHYFNNQVPNAKAIIQLLQKMDKSIYLVSAGLKPAVSIFGELLKISQANIFAVDILFDQQGNFLDYDRTSPLVRHDGKCTILSSLKKKHSNIVHIGDGLNDYVTKNIVTRFIGYGGVFYRESLAARCQYYIRSLSMAALLPFILTEQEQQQLTLSEQQLYRQGLSELKKK